MVVERPDGALDLDARLSIEEFEAQLGAVMTDDEREADIDTVGGLVFTLAGRVPARGEVISHPSGRVPDLGCGYAADSAVADAAVGGGGLTLLLVLTALGD